MCVRERASVSARICVAEYECVCLRVYAKRIQNGAIFYWLYSSLITGILLLPPPPFSLSFYIIMIHNFEVYNHHIFFHTLAFHPAMRQRCFA